MSERSSSPAEVIAEDFSLYTHDPLRFTKYVFPWNESGDLAQSSGPRVWQSDVLQTIGQHLSAPETRYQPCRVAVSSGKGIGKSALVGMIINWAMSTCLDCKIVLTANTLDQLRTKTWPEVLKWTRLAINSGWWTMGATSLTFRDKQHERTWRTDMLSWSEDNSQAFAGLHNQGKRIVVVFDEASEIVDKIWQVAEGALTDSATEIIWIAFGNPTKNTGRFSQCFGNLRHRWITRQIDARKVEGTNLEQIKQWIEDYGEDDDWVRVLVRGEFPRGGFSQSIASDSVATCRKFRAEGFAALPKILAVDVARYGDDRTVIGIRQGRQFRVVDKMRGADTVAVAERTIEHIEREAPDAVVVDGDGIGGGVCDQLVHRNYGRSLHEFHGAARALDANKYANRRCEVWGLMRDAIVAGMQIPDDPELAADLCGPQYNYSPKQQLQLERKEVMKSRGLASPDMADCLAYSFAVTIAAKQKPKYQNLVYSVGAQNLRWMG